MTHTDAYLGMITCCSCKHKQPLYKDRRNICLSCGLDFGRVLPRPLTLVEMVVAQADEVHDDFDPNITLLAGLVRDALLEC
jgi:hypothetical protein